jgi:hypothetical protein
MEIDDLLPPHSRAFEEEYHRLARSDSPFESRVGKMMLDFLNRLRSGVVGPRLSALKSPASYAPKCDFGIELWLQYSDNHGHHTMITVTIDYKDRSPLVDGVPPLHYRLAYTLPDRDSGKTTPKAELRTSNLDTACDFVLEAIHACRGGP